MNKLSGKTSAHLKVPRVQFIYLHHVFPDEESKFRELIKELLVDHSIISHSEAVSRVQTGQIDRAYMSISFDDGLKNCVTAGKILSEFALSGCFFVCPNIVGEENERRIEEFCKQRLHMPPLEFMSWAEVESLMRSGHEIGSHTMDHAELAKVSPDDLQDEIHHSFEVLRNRLGSVTHFAWPYGTFGHFSASARKAVFSAGFQSCASAERGCHVNPTAVPGHDLCLRRDHVIAAWPLSHVTYFIARSSGMGSPQNDYFPANLAN